MRSNTQRSSELSPRSGHFLCWWQLGGSNYETTPPAPSPTHILLDRTFAHLPPWSRHPQTWSPGGAGVRMAGHPSWSLGVKLPTAILTLASFCSAVCPENWQGQALLLPPRFICSIQAVRRCPFPSQPSHHQCYSDDLCEDEIWIPNDFKPPSRPIKTNTSRPLTGSLTLPRTQWTPWLYRSRCIIFLVLGQSPAYSKDKSYSHELRD